MEKAPVALIRDDGCSEGIERKEKQIGSRRSAPFNLFIVGRSIAPVIPSLHACPSVCISRRRAGVRPESSDMLPTPTITALHLVPLDVGHHVGMDRQMPVGAAVLTATLKGSCVHFTLDSCILRPSDPTDTLLLWLDRHVMRDDVTIAGFRLNDAVALLDRLPGAEWSPVLRALAGCGQQYALDLSARSDGESVTFQQACGCSGILCAPVDADRRFADWIRSDVRGLAHDAEVDALATFRLVIRRLAVLNPIARGIVGAIADHFATWLEQADHPAAQAHVADLLSVAD